MILTGYVKQSKCGIILTLCLQFIILVFTFAGHMSIELLQSSINPKGGLGLITISILYAFRALSCLLGPFIVIQLTPKWTMVISITMQLVYLGANFYPRWYTLYPAAVLAGFTVGPLYVCFGVYITTLAVYYSHITTQHKGAVLSKFNGIFALGMPVAISMGSIISSVVFKYVHFDDSGNVCISPTETCATQNTTRLSVTMVDINATNSMTYNYTYHWETNFCTVNYCPNVNFNVTNEELPNHESLYVLLGIYAVLNFLAIVLNIFFLKNLPKRDIQSGIQLKKTVCQQFVSYFKAFFNWRYLLLIPCIAYLYMFFAISNSTFNKGYVTCSFGIQFVGISGLIIGATAGLFSYIAGLLGQCIHRNYLLLIAYVILLVHLGILLFWDLFPWPKVTLIVACVTAGISIGINICQFPAFIGDAFTSTKTEVFSFYYFISGVTMALGFLSSKYLCATHQIYLLLAIMAVGFVTYTILSIHLYKTTSSDLPAMETIQGTMLQETGPMINHNRSRSIAELADSNGPTESNGPIAIYNKSRSNANVNEEPLLSGTNNISAANPSDNSLESSL